MGHDNAQLNAAVQALEASYEQVVSANENLHGTTLGHKIENRPAIEITHTDIENFGFRSTHRKMGHE